MAGVWSKNFEALKRSNLLAGFVKSGWSTMKNTSGSYISYAPGYVNFTMRIVTGAINGSPLTTNNYPDGASNASRSIENTNCYNQSAGNTNYIIFGTGTTTPTADDYNIGAATTGTYTTSSTTSSLDEDDVNLILTRSFKIVKQLTSATAETITEWALMTKINGNNSVLLYHELLDTPITINQYESFSLEGSISLQLTDPVALW